MKQRLRCLGLYWWPFWAILSLNLFLHFNLTYKSHQRYVVAACVRIGLVLCLGFLCWANQRRGERERRKLMEALARVHQERREILGRLYGDVQL